MTDSKTGKVTKPPIIFLVISTIVIIVGVIIVINLIEAEKDGWVLDESVIHTCDSLKLLTDKLSDSPTDKYPTLREQVSAKQKELGC